MASQRIGIIESKRTRPTKSESRASNGEAAPIDLVSRIQRIEHELSPAERRVAEAIVADYQGATLLSIGDLATRAGVSQPSVTRFCRSVGCSSFSEFKVRLATTLAVAAVYLKTDRVFDDDAGQIARSVMIRASDAIRDCLEQLDTGAVAEAITTIARAARLDIYGQGGGRRPSSRTRNCACSVSGFPSAPTSTAISSGCPPPLCASATSPLRSPTAAFETVVGAIEIARSYGAATIAMTPAEYAARRGGGDRHSRRSPRITTRLCRRVALCAYGRHRHDRHRRRVRDGRPLARGVAARALYAGEHWRRDPVAVLGSGAADENAEAAGVGSDGKGRDSMTKSPKQAQGLGVARAVRQRLAPARYRRCNIVCSASNATGATSSPSLGTSGRSRAAARSRRCSRPISRRSPSHWRVEGERRRRRGDRSLASFRDRGGARPRRSRLRRRKAFTLLTTLEELKGFEERKGRPGPWGSSMASMDAATMVRGAKRRTGRAGDIDAALLPDRRRRARRDRAWRAAQTARRADDHPGEECAAGDSWRCRYRTLVLHDPVWYDHLPHIPFPKTGRYSRPRTSWRIGWKCMCEVMELDYWTAAECTRGAV